MDFDTNIASAFWLGVRSKRLRHRRKHNKRTLSKPKERFAPNGRAFCGQYFRRSRSYSKAITMKIDTITLIISGALLAAALVFLFVGHMRRRHHLKRHLLMDLLKSYFKGDVPAKELRRRTRGIVSQHFTRSNEFYSLVVSAFQGAVDATLTQQTHTEQGERKLLSAMATLKHEFGLTDLYQVEAWRPWRE